MLNQQTAYSALSAQFKKEHDEEVNAFVEESRFAKVVRTEHGDAILVNGEVIEVRCSNQAFIVDALVRALRRAGGKLEIASGAGAE